MISGTWEEYVIFFCGLTFVYLTVSDIANIDPPINQQANAGLIDRTIIPDRSVIQSNLPVNQAFNPANPYDTSLFPRMFPTPSTTLTPPHFQTGQPAILTPSRVQEAPRTRGFSDQFMEHHVRGLGNNFH